MYRLVFFWAFLNYSAQVFIGFLLLSRDAFLSYLIFFYLPVTPMELYT